MTPTCTAVGCDQPARHREIGTDGREWAHLCGHCADTLHATLTTAWDHSAGKRATLVLDAWTHAAGGPEVLLERMA